MTPKEAADDIHSKMWDVILDNVEKIEGLNEAAKACAILHCQGIIEAMPKGIEYPHEYWNQVLNEIQSL